MTTWRARGDHEPTAYDDDRVTDGTVRQRPSSGVHLGGRVGRREIIAKVFAGPAILPGQNQTLGRNNCRDIRFESAARKKRMGAHSPPVASFLTVVLHFLFLFFGIE